MFSLHLTIICNHRLWIPLMRLGTSCDFRVFIVPSAQPTVIPLLIIAARVSERGRGGESVTVSCRKPDRSTHASKRGGRAAASGGNAALHFWFSPAMGRGAPGLFKRLMPLDDVKAAAVAQQERDGMAGGPLEFF